MMDGVALVLAPRETTLATAEEAVARLIAPFNAALEVAPYCEPCSCMGAEADLDVIKAVVRATRAESDDLERRYAALRAAVVEASRGEADGRDDPLQAIDTIPAVSVRRDLAREMAELDERCARHQRETRRSLRLGRRARPLAGEPDLECEQYGGSGERVTTANPQGRWTSWRIGGSGSGLLDPNYDPGADPRNFSECENCDPISHLQYVRRELRTADADTGLEYQREAVIPTGEDDPLAEALTCEDCHGTGVRRNEHNVPTEGDVRPVDQLAGGLVRQALADLVVTGLVTPDGQWHTPSDADRDRVPWPQLAAGLLELHRDATAVVVEIEHDPFFNCESDPDAPSIL